MKYPLDSNSQPLSASWTPEARRLWRTIPMDKQELILQNVYCSQCSSMVTMVKFSGREEQRDLILTGVCATCGGKVARVIETGETILKDTKK
jgi:ATP diphosphatase